MSGKYTIFFQYKNIHLFFIFLKCYVAMLSSISFIFFMKYFLFILLLPLAFLSCQDDIQTSSPTFQGLQQGDFVWRSTVRTATVQSSGVLSISGSDGYGTMIISLPEAAVGVYTLGQGELSTITFTEGITTYSTQNNGTEFPVYLGDGQVTLEEVNTVSKTLKGSFYFNSYDDEGSKYLNFSEGVFYNLRYID
ncbi:hypothetical protein FORMA_04810 [Formosa sp. Hel3_A1_48]|jgi:hypothetical protein|nr:hypothetical protein FORMA_04810 [Formosa sp. Hel3_A1_48]